jgi:hypothetical protein
MPAISAGFKFTIKKFADALPHGPGGDAYRICQLSIFLHYDRKIAPVHLEKQVFQPAGPNPYIR